jgi:endonuclease/exonuclease/phosphatase family metal-dependent hydrolase
MKTRVLTFNIRRGLGSDMKLNLSRTASVIAESGAEIVCLQEVYKGGWLPSVDQQKSLIELTMLNGEFAKTHSLIGLSWGNMILSKHKFVSVDVVPFTSGFEKRVCQVARVNVKGKEITVLNTHFGLTKKFRSLQKKEIVEISNKYNADIICGDFNCDISEDYSIDGFSFAIKGISTYPSPNPKKSLDNIIFRDGFKIKNATTIKTLASDHLPVYSEFEF